MRLSGRWCVVAACLALAWAAAARAKAPADWRLGPDSFGPFKVGMPFAQAQTLAPGLNATPASLRASSGCDQLPLPGHPGVALMFVDGGLARIDLFRPGPRTTRGVGPGSRVAQAMRAYPGMRVEPRAYEENERFFTQRSGANAIRFETAKGHIENVYAGRWAQVQYIEGCL
ncbi:hypothetical protein [Massilia sp. Bi118]|uniref:hypothetical protein n=1 Tax=Massilia sp. Bi118 TaxID=2822346 RepID=UPI001E353C81|nr:hypothetical protein [Massilia sp. Bi118]